MWRSQRAGLTRRRSPRSLLQDHSGEQRVTNIELFFDLVYVFAVTQMSHHLLAVPTVEGALQTALLLALVWWAWVYTTWATNWLDARRIPVRLLLIALMLVSLVLSAALPGAFGSRGLIVAGAYVLMQVGRSAFVAIAGRGRRVDKIFTRVTVWSAASGCVWIAGAFVGGHARELVWLAALGVDLLGDKTGFYTPGMGATTSAEWTIAGGHFAERCQAFIIIALGESIVVIGQALSVRPDVSASVVAAFVTAFAGSVALWWVYFDRSAEDGARVIAESPDPGRLANSAYHLIHPVMVAGIIVAASADQEVLAHPGAVGRTAGSWMVIGGPVLFLAGHVLFKRVIWGVISWPRITAIAVLLLLLLVLAPLVLALVLNVMVVLVLVAVAVSDRFSLRGAAVVAGPQGRSQGSPDFEQPAPPA
ncbi:MAG: low temperature requirement protein A [Streptosporangiaceae bacterium]